MVKTNRIIILCAKLAEQSNLIYIMIKMDKKLILILVMS